VSASAEEALSQAHQGAYSLFVCDIEMPGMDGFEFVKRARESDDLRGIPSIMVTSRSGEENRKHAVEVGARAYICKSEFDEQTLLSTIRGLVG
jgi:two-component system, chemotaxis family, sensor kinase CheA